MSVDRAEARVSAITQTQRKHTTYLSAHSFKPHRDRCGGRTRRRKAKSPSPGPEIDDLVVECGPSRALCTSRVDGSDSPRMLCVLRLVNRADGRAVFVSCCLTLALPNVVESQACWVCPSCCWCPLLPCVRLLILVDPSADLVVRWAFG